MTPAHPRYAATRYPRSATNAEELTEMRRKAWRAQGVLTLRLDEVADEWLRAALANWAAEHYGPRQERPTA